MSAVTSSMAPRCCAGGGTAELSPWGLGASGYSSVFLSNGSPCFWLELGLPAPPHSASHTGQGQTALRPYEVLMFPLEGAACVHVSMCACKHVWACICMHVPAGINASLCFCVHTHTCKSMCVQTPMCICLHVPAEVCAPAYHGRGAWWELKL